MLSIKSNIEEFSRDLDYQARTQIPYATALALNSLARLVIAGEIEEVEKDFPTATPFTKRAFGYIPASKGNQFTTIFVKDIQERYLDPYTDGGQSVPTQGGAMLVPEAIGVNQYGNIPYKKIKSLIGKGNVFYANKADQKFHGARAYSGVFERVQYGTGPRGGKLTRLVTLVKIEDPWNVKQHFDFEIRCSKFYETNTNFQYQHLKRL